jgi:hypothetical protein
MGLLLYLLQSEESIDLLFCSHITLQLEKRLRCQFEDFSHFSLFLLCMQKVSYKNDYFRRQLVSETILNTMQHKLELYDNEKSYIMICDIMNLLSTLSYRHWDIQYQFKKTGWIEYLCQFLLKARNIPKWQEYVQWKTLFLLSSLVYQNQKIQSQLQKLLLPQLINWFQSNQIIPRMKQSILGLIVCICDLSSFQEDINQDELEVIKNITILITPHFFSQVLSFVVYNPSIILTFLLFFIPFIRYQTVSMKILDDIIAWNKNSLYFEITARMLIAFMENCPKNAAILKQKLQLKDFIQVFYIFSIFQKKN